MRTIEDVVEELKTIHTDDPTRDMLDEILKIHDAEHLEWRTGTPPARDEYLVTYSNCTEILKYNGSEWGKWEDLYWNKCNKAVTAWMPLPSPYKGKDSEDKVEIIEPTDKQVDYAIDIARMLSIPLPAEKTKQAYSDFISKNVDEFKRIKMRNYLDDGDFGEFLGMGTWDI